MKRPYLLPLICYLLSYGPILFFKNLGSQSINETFLQAIMLATIPWIVIIILNTYYKPFKLAGIYEIIMGLIILAPTALCLYFFTIHKGEAWGMHYYIIFFAQIGGIAILLSIILIDYIMKKACGANIPKPIV